MRQIGILLLACALAGLVACGGTNTSTPANNPLSGNWQISLQRHAHPGTQVYTGFLLESGPVLTGSLVLGGGCNGVGPVSGTISGQDLSLSIDEFGQEISLTGTLPEDVTNFSPSTLIGGSFSSVAGGCTDFASTGTWSAMIVPSLSGSFHGTLNGVSGTGADIFNVNGTIAQGTNSGSSNATLSGTISAIGTPHFCPYLTTATISGLISGTSVTLQLFDSTGAEIAQIAPLSLSPDATSLKCAQGATSCYSFPPISSTCIGEQGTVEISFP